VNLEKKPLRIASCISIILQNQVILY